MEKTAVEQLIETMIRTKLVPEDTHPNNILFEQAKIVEKQQNEDTFNNARKNKSDCQVWNCEGTQKTYETFEEYWKENFKSE